MRSYRHTAGLGLVVLEVSHAAWLASACVMIAGKKGRRREREEEKGRKNLPFISARAL